jgi:hypothetical protein
LQLIGLTSGGILIQPSAVAGTYNFNLPTSAGTAGQPLLSGGGGSTAMTFGTLGVAGGGTGATSFTTNAILKGAGTSPIVAAGVLIDVSNNVTSVAALTGGTGRFESNLTPLAITGGSTGVEIGDNGAGFIQTAVRPSFSYGTHDLYLLVGGNLILSPAKTTAGST